jgi:prevent-host-death family protein
MTISIAQTRQHLSALIVAAQQEPQIITNRNTPVAVLVSADYFRHSQAAVKREAATLYNQILMLRENYMPIDNNGLSALSSTTRQNAWVRDNPFTDAQSTEA